MSNQLISPLEVKFTDADKARMQIRSGDATDCTKQCAFGAAVEKTEATLEPKMGRLMTRTKVSLVSTQCNRPRDGIVFAIGEIGVNVLKQCIEIRLLLPIRQRRIVGKESCSLGCDLIHVLAP